MELEMENEQPSNRATEQPSNRATEQPSFNAKDLQDIKQRVSKDSDTLTVQQIEHQITELNEALEERRDALKQAGLVEVHTNTGISST
jgi:hypothetical protein